jgi:phosphatidylglycerophosphate synthase
MTESYTPADRRPIATREKKGSKAMAAWLVRRGVSANAISVFGMLCGIASGFTLAATTWSDPMVARVLWLASACLVQLRLSANMLDGMVAVGSGTASSVGELYNEVPDRVSDTFTLAGLGYAAGGFPLFGWIAALLAMFTAYVRAIGKVAGAPQEFCGPMAKPHRMFLATVTSLYCAFAPLSWQPHWELAWFRGGVGALVLAVIAIGALITALRRLSRVARNLHQLKGTK